MQAVSGGCSPARTPSGVSRGVSRFEEQLGVRLFNRHPRAIALTDEGQLGN
jgi:DNA-binding transcriptional LysR family regulator